MNLFWLGPRACLLTYCRSSGAQEYHQEWYFDKKNIFEPKMSENESKIEYGEKRVFVLPGGLQHIQLSYWCHLGCIYKKVYFFLNSDQFGSKKRRFLGRKSRFYTHRDGNICLSRGGKLCFSIKNRCFLYQNWSQCF